MRNHLARPLLAAAFALLAPAPLSAAATPDTAQLRQALADAFGGDIEIARTELSDGLRERGDTFWLVYAAPRRSGDYVMNYRYEYRDHIALQYGSRPLPGPRYGRPPAASTISSEAAPAPDPVPAIAGFPFQLDAEERFNAWIADHLPSPKN
jgi:hypothetical protein